MDKPKTTELIQDEPTRLDFSRYNTVLAVVGMFLIILSVLV